MFFVTYVFIILGFRLSEPFLAEVCDYSRTEGWLAGAAHLLDSRLARVYGVEIDPLLLRLQKARDIVESDALLSALFHLGYPALDFKQFRLIGDLLRRGDTANIDIKVASLLKAQLSSAKLSAGRKQQGEEFDVISAILDLKDKKGSEVARKKSEAAKKIGLAVVSPENFDDLLRELGGVVGGGVTEDEEQGVEQGVNINKETGGSISTKTKEMSKKFLEDYTGSQDYRIVGVKEGSQEYRIVKEVEQALKLDKRLKEADIAQRGGKGGSAPRSDSSRPHIETLLKGRGGGIKKAELEELQREFQTTAASIYDALEDTASTVRFVPIWLFSFRRHRTNHRAPSPRTDLCRT